MSDKQNTQIVLPIVPVNFSLSSTLTLSSVLTIFVRLTANFNSNQPICGVIN